MTTREKVEHIEKKYDVGSLRVKRFGKSFQVYPWLKGRLFHKLITGNETLQKRDIKLYWKQFTSIFYGLHNIFRKYDAWAFTSSMERREVDGVYHDKIVDHLGSQTGLKTLVIELRLFQYIPYRKIASRYAMSKSFFMLFEELYGRLFLRKIEVENEAMMHELLKEVSGGVNHKQILRKYLAQYKMMKFWLRLLHRPKVVFVAVSYTNFGYIRAFREAGIKVVEVQHGVISKNHHAYFYDAEMNPEQFPEYLITVGEKELSVFDEENKFPVSEVVAVGSWIIDHYRQKAKEVKNDPPVILFALQDGVMSEKLLPFILELENRLEGTFKLKVQPRRTQKETYVKSFPALEDIEFSEDSFYAAVIQSDVHCTVYSTTAIEALSLGIPNILINIDNQSEEQLGTILGENPFTFIVDTVDEFIAVLPKVINTDREFVSESNAYNIRKGYEQNVQVFVKKLLDA